MSKIDQVINGLERISAMAQLRDKVIYARQAERNHCGSCQHWMKSRDCPRERNVNGMSRGPSSGDYPCGKFAITDSALDLRKERWAEAASFAEKYSLPVPAGPEAARHDPR